MATKIQWTENVWNPVTGCTKISAACKNCYAEVMAKRLSGMPATKEKYKNRFEVTLHPESLEEPFKWRKSCMVFVCSMGDLFHEKVPFEYIDKVMDVIRRCHEHTFQILTKRAERMAEYFSYVTRPVPSNSWIGVTCETPVHYDRVRMLQSIEAPVRFISAEPLLCDISDIPLKGIHWLITGGESGVHARPTSVEWFLNLRNYCRKEKVPFFFKQWGAYGEDGIKRSKYQNGSLLDGAEWKMMPGDNY